MGGRSEVHFDLLCDAYDNYILHRKDQALDALMSKLKETM